MVAQWGLLDLPGKMLNLKKNCFFFNEEALRKPNSKVHQGQLTNTRLIQKTEVAEKPLTFK